MTREHRIEDGDCVSSVAASHGLDAAAVWNHPDNAALREQRKDPNVLAPGDTLHLPEPSLRSESRTTDERHRFVRFHQTKLRLRLTEDDKPRAHLAYSLEIDGWKVEGTTNGDGILEQAIPSTAKSAVLVLQAEGGALTLPLAIGSLDPLETECGLGARLRGAGFDTEAGIESAVRGFQSREGLEVTGKADEATRARLRETFGQ